jgi:hypothetical protein
MEVRTVMVSLLSRFWFDLAPAMGKADAVRRSQQIALTLKIKGGLQLVCRPHDTLQPEKRGGNGRQPAAAGRGRGGARGGGAAGVMEEGLQ